ncbi:MAG: hypothetical protein C4346_14550 [Chloroflexota bacterium]
MVLRKLILTLLTILGLSLVAGPVALAGNGAVSETTTSHGATETFTDVLPCVGGALYQITITYNQVDHLTTLPNGTVHVTFTQTGTFEAVPVADPSLPSYTGHFTIWGGFNGNQKNAASTFTFTIKGTGSDGSRIDFHETAHFNTSATGLVVEFDKISC